MPSAPRDTSPYGRRSRSPHEPRREHRSRAPRRHSHRHYSSKNEVKPVRLPFKQEPLRKRDYGAYRNVFADYLDLQKSIQIEDLSEEETRGRWKSFLGKWNRGELAEGWYDPGMRSRADERAAAAAPVRQASTKRSSKHVADERAAAAYGHQKSDVEDDEPDDDDGYGPALPPSAGQRWGPHVPTSQDLQYRQELADEARQTQRADSRYERKSERKAQRDRLDELVPRAEPGTRERQMEKKREVAASNRSFAQAKEAGETEVPESDLMGTDGADEFKKQIREKERAKNEREIRKEEQLRARAAEREERMQQFRAKEDKTMDMLRQLAEQRFGGGGT